MVEPAPKPPTPAPAPAPAPAPEPAPTGDWRDKLVRIIRATRDATGSPLLSRILKDPQGVLAHVKRESEGSTKAHRNEKKGPKDKEDRHSYGLFQIMDKYARGLSDKRSWLGSLSGNVPAAPPKRAPGPGVDPDNPDTGNPAWRDVLTKGDAAYWWGMLWLLNVERSLVNTYFTMAEDGTLAPKPGLTGSKADAVQKIAEYTNAASQRTGVPAPWLLLRQFGKAGSVFGMRNEIKKGAADATVSNYLPYWRGEAAYAARLRS